MKIIQIIIGFTGAALLSPLAQSSDLQKCASIAKADNRLECFERMARAENTYESEVISKMQESKTKERFGLSKTQIRLQNKVTRVSIKTNVLTFNVSKTEKDYEKRHLFYMHNGQVWREIEPSTIYFPDRQFDVTIKQGILGDYRMRINGKSRMARVKRLK